MLGLVAYDNYQDRWTLIAMTGAYLDFVTTVKDFEEGLTKLGKEQFPIVMEVEIERVQKGDTTEEGDLFFWSPEETEDGVSPLPVMPTLQERIQKNIKVLKSHLAGSRHLSENRRTV